MADDSIIFGLANPNPEVHPDVAHRYARIVATGRSDFPNQINNVLAFPGIFRGAFDVHATAITEGMKLAAAEALAGAGRRRPRRRPDRPLAVRPAGRPGGGRGGRGRSARRRRRPPLRTPSRRKQASNHAEAAPTGTRIAPSRTWRLGVGGWRGRR